MNTSAVFYQAYKAKAGALFRACIDSDCNDPEQDGAQAVLVNAHDDTEDGTSPPVSCSSLIFLAVWLKPRPRKPSSLLPYKTSQRPILSP